MLAVKMDVVPAIRLIGFVSYRTPWIHFKRNIDEYILYFIKSGELHLKEDGKTYALRRGDVFLLEPNLDHEGTEKHRCDYYYVHFSHAGISAREAEDVGALAKRVLLEEAEDDGEDANVCHFGKHFAIENKAALLKAYHTMDELRELHGRKRYNGSLSSLRFSQLLIELSREHLAQALRKSGGKQAATLPKVHALLDHIHRHYVDKISGDDLARTFDCNFDYLNRVFKRTTGYPIVQYMNKVRTDRAMELLQATNLSIGEIGYLTGLNDPFYFSKVFKKHVGLSPQQYRLSLGREQRVDGR